MIMNTKPTSAEIDLGNHNGMGDILVFPPMVLAAAVESLGAFFEPLSGVERNAAARDHLDPAKAVKHAEVLQRYTPLEGKKLLEIGSGFGVTLAVLSKRYKVDGYGVEPDGIGFSASFAASRELFAANGLDAARIMAGVGEKLPFQDESFDIVYSCNVLEHTKDPERVLHEAIRVLRPGGVLHFEIPNHLSYFEGHYLVIQPPIFWKPILPFWVRFIFGRDPSFARTLQTQINPLWCSRVVRRIGRDYPVQLMSLGHDLFLERLTRPFHFEMHRVASRLGTMISLLQRLNLGNWIGRLIVLVQGYYPIYLTVRKKLATMNRIH